MVGGRDAPALYFGATKINNKFDIVDDVSKEDSDGMTATFFVKSGDEFIRVSTSVPKPRPLRHLLPSGAARGQKVRPRIGRDRQGELLNREIDQRHSLQRS